jgi:hypothetical protein
MDNETHAELVRLRYSVAAMREWIATNLNAVEAQIEALLPEDQVPDRPACYDRETVRGWFKDSNQRKLKHISK